MPIAAEHSQIILYMTVSVNIHTQNTFALQTFLPVTCECYTILFFPLTTCLQRQLWIIWKALISYFMGKRWRMKGKGVPVHATKLCTCVNGGADPLILTLSTTWRVNVQVCATVALTSGEGALWTHWTGSRMVPRTAPATLEKTQIPCLMLTSHNTTHCANWAIPAPAPPFHTHIIMCQNSITVLWPYQLKTSDVRSPPRRFEVEKDLVYSSISHVFNSLLNKSCKL